MVYPDYEGPHIEILFENDDVVILNKPPNIHCHPLKYSEKNNCLSFLRQQLKNNIMNVNKKSYDRGLLYRLDYVTSGVLFFIKTESLFTDLRANFNELVKEKFYLAIVEGDFNREGEHKSIFTFKEQKGRKVVIKKSQTSKNENFFEGVLSIKKLHFNSENNMSIVVVKLETGIRHQIRVQLSALGYPILGDELYGGSPSERIFLHAFYYEIPISGQSIKGVSRNAQLFDCFFDMDSIFKMLKD
ncbi:MAG: RNA pseudouridine synthase [Bdellovibrionota bacterium]|nr:RNA pseudouridine synthase [Bdellovibrionota bacterium]